MQMEKEVNLSYVQVRGFCKSETPPTPTKKKKKWQTLLGYKISI